MASVPGKSELAPSAFGKLDANRRGYVTREDVSQLSGFDKVFQQADANDDGRLNAEEFNRAWSLYANQK
jgi:Ca2+-binding EF-hand superfamily protein